MAAHPNGATGDKMHGEGGRYMEGSNEPAHDGWQFGENLKDQAVCQWQRRPGPTQVE